DLSEGEDVYLLRANFTPIYQDHYSEMISGYITVLSDVTEERKIEQERREFVSNVSHELRTPLTSLRSYLEALADGAYKDPNIAPKFLQVTQDETERMIRMVIVYYNFHGWIVTSKPITKGEMISYHYSTQLLIALK